MAKKSKIAAKKKNIMSCTFDPNIAGDEMIGADPPMDFEWERIPVSEPAYEIITEEALISEPTPNMELEEALITESTPNMELEEAFVAEPIPDMELTEASIVEPTPDMELEEASVAEPTPDMESEEASMSESTHETAAEEVPIPEPTDKVATEEASTTESKNLSVTEESKNGLFTSNGPISQQPREWPYTKPPVELLIGPNKTVHYVPRRLLSPEWSKAGPERQWYLPNLTMDTGHTLAHYLHTGVYETMDTQIDSPPITPFMKLKRALSVYFASTDCGLLGLQHLAMGDMTKHAVEIDLIDFLRAVKNDFNKFGPISWVHACLYSKAKAAFEDDHTVFRSEAFLGNLENPTVNRYMMKCVTELYENRVSDMLRREKEMSQSLEDCYQTIQVLSEKQDVSEQTIDVQEDFITPECSGNQTFQDDLLSDQEFCTISCPSSECPNESLEEFTLCSPDRTGHFKDTGTYSHDTDSAESMPCEQQCLSTHLAPECSTETIQAPIVDAMPERYKSGTGGSHIAPAPKLSKELSSLSSKVDEKKENKKQKKLRKRKERQEMRELWEATKQQRLDATKEGNTSNEWTDQPTHLNKARDRLSWRAGAKDEPGRLSVHATELLAALAAIINDIQPSRSSSDTQETIQAPKPLSNSPENHQSDCQGAQEKVEAIEPTHAPSLASDYNSEKAATYTAEGSQKLRRSARLEAKSKIKKETEAEAAKGKAAERPT